VKSVVTSGRSVLTPASTAIHVVQFEQKARPVPRRKEPPVEDRVPRVARLLALAHRIDGMVRSGELRDWAEAARLVGVTRARMTQIANLLLLAPSIQETIMHAHPVADGQDPFTERDLRQIPANSSWKRQVSDFMRRDVGRQQLAGFPL